MAHYRTYDEEMQHLRNLLHTISSDEENIDEDDDFLDNEETDEEEYYSEHDSSTEIESNSENDISDSSEDDCFIGRNKITKWNKEKFQANCRISVKNISKLPGNIPVSKNVTSVDS